MVLSDVDISSLPGWVQAIVGVGIALGAGISYVLAAKKKEQPVATNIDELREDCEAAIEAVKTSMSVKIDGLQTMLSAFMKSTTDRFDKNEEQIHDREIGEGRQDERIKNLEKWRDRIETNGFNHHRR